MKHWNIGNTTVRNPDRIKDGLRVLRDNFEGKIWDEKAHERYYDLLVKYGVVEPSGKELARDSKGIGGRKWAACCNQLGFARAWKRAGVVVITDAGHALLGGQVIESEVFLREFLKLHLPSPLERGVEYGGFDIYPFRLTLKIIDTLLAQDLVGITKEEIGLFLITNLLNSDEQKTLEKIISYRKARNSLTGKARKKAFYHVTKKQTIKHLYEHELKEKYDKLQKLLDQYRGERAFLSTNEAQNMINNIVARGTGFRTKRARDCANEIVTGVKSGQSLEELKDHIDNLYVTVRGKTLVDYADTTVRYFAKSGLLSLSGDKLILKETELPLIRQIVSEGYPEYNEETYLVGFYDSKMPQLPSDNQLFLQSNIQELVKLRDNLAARIDITPTPMSHVPTSASELRHVGANIKKEISSYKETIFYLGQQEQIEDIIDYFEQIADRSLLGGDAYRPAYFEWTVWRVFLAIDALINPISDTRRFEIDEELNPIHHARGGVADMIFEYDDFVLAVEATLRTTANQWSAEGEPVPRHVADEMQRYSDRPVYGLFVAPTIDPNTTQQFFSQTYWIGDQQVDVNIVPITIDQLIGILKKFELEKFTTSTLGLLIQQIIDLKVKAKHGVEWKASIDNYLSLWLKTPIAS